MFYYNVYYIYFYLAILMQLDAIVYYFVNTVYSTMEILNGVSQMWCVDIE